MLLSKTHFCEDEFGTASLCFWWDIYQVVRTCKVLKLEILMHWGWGNPKPFEILSSQNNSRNGNLVVVQIIAFILTLT